MFLAKQDIFKENDHYRPTKIIGREGKENHCSWKGKSSGWLSDDVGLATLINFFELPQDQTELPEDRLLFESDNDSEYQVSYIQLIFVKNPRKDSLQVKF